VNRRLVLAAAIAAIIAAQAVRGFANDERGELGTDEPFAPSPTTTQVISLGYRELVADLLFFRLIGYFGGGSHTAEGVAALVEAIAAADPNYEKIYVWGGRAMVASRHGLSNEVALRAVALLERGAAVFPQDHKIPMLAGEILLTNVQAKDPEEKRRLNERAAKFIESAVRKPNAPASAATLAAHLRSKLGQRQQAIDSLREMMLITQDEGARKQLLEKLSELAGKDADAIASELLESRRRFERAWRTERPSVPPGLFVLIGAREEPGFDLGDLATGGRDLVGADSFEQLEPLDD
jgi:hypothetical protein